MTRNQARGAESFAVLVAEQLRRRGLDVRLVSLAAGRSGSEPLPIESLGGSPLGAATLLRLRREIGQAAVVVACGSRTLPAAVIASLGRPRPLVYQNIGDPHFWASSPLRRARVRTYLRRVSAVAALTEQSARILATDFGVPSAQVRVIRNGRSARTFTPSTPQERVTARRRLGVPEDVPVVALVGALSREKRVDLAISAVAGLGVPAVLMVAGEGPERGRLETAAAHVAPDRVCFLGRCSDVRSVYAAADAVLLTSDSEGVPGVLVEAGLSGLPVVSTDVGFVRDVVVDGVTGRLAPRGDVNALTQALGAVLAARAEMGAAARSHCVARFDLEVVSDEWHRLLGAVLAQRPVAG